MWRASGRKFSRRWRCDCLTGRLRDQLPESTRRQFRSVIRFTPGKGEVAAAVRLPWSDDRAGIDRGSGPLSGWPSRFSLSVAASLNTGAQLTSRRDRASFVPSIASLTDDAPREVFAPSLWHKLCSGSVGRRPRVHRQRLIEASVRGQSTCLSPFALPGCPLARGAMIRGPGFLERIIHGCN